MENVGNPILEHLRVITTDVAAIRDDVRKLKSRVAHLEVGQADMMQRLGHHASITARQQPSYDRIVERIEKIEKRLELAN